MDDKRFRSDRGRDPIEIARLIAQADTHEESASSDSRFREETVSDGYDETPELPPAPQLAVDLNEQEQACKRDEHCSGAQAYDVDDQLYAAEEEYQDSEVPPYAAEEHYQDNEISHVRRHSRTLVMAIFGLALVGSAYAVGYRNMFGGSGSPTLPPTIKAINERNRIASVSEPQPASSGNAREISPATTGSIDSMVSREEQPATIGLPKAASRASLPRASAPAPSAAGQAVANQAVPRSAVAAEPPAPRFAVAASPERPGQSNGAHVTAASDHEHLDAGSAPPNSTAAVTLPCWLCGPSYVRAQ